MKNLLQQPYFLITLLLYALLPNAQAAENERFLIQDEAGFFTSLPDITDIMVTQHLMELQQNLKSELATLQAEVARKRFKPVDTLITVVMPGGLLYAKLRHDSYKSSQYRMNRVGKLLANISGELVIFQAKNEQVLIATAE
jgi:hypothetical protein